MLTDQEIAAFADRLRGIIAELEAADESSAASRAPVTLDQTATGRLTRMDALQQQAMAQATHRRRARERVRVTQALVRIDEDAFGDCVVCGEPIAVKRLDLDPATPVCIGCASAAP